MTPDFDTATCGPVRSKGPGVAGVVTRLTSLYLRSRFAGWAGLSLGGVALASWAGTYWLLRNGYPVNTSGLVPMLVMGTLAAACAVGVGARSPFVELERTAARSLPALRLGHLVGLLLCAVALLVSVLLAFELDGARPPEPLPALVRNLAGLAGLAFITARLLGAGLSWTTPFVYAFAVLMEGEGPGVEAKWWALPLFSGTDGLSWMISLSMLAIGLGLICLSGERESAEEPE